MKTKTPKAKDETLDLETLGVAVETPEAVAELHETVVETPEPTAEVVIESAPTGPNGKKSVRRIMLTPVYACYHAGRGAVGLAAKGSKAVGKKSLKVVGRGQKKAPIQATEGHVNVTAAEAVPEAEIHA